MSENHSTVDLAVPIRNAIMTVGSRFPPGTQALPPSPDRRIVAAGLDALLVVAAAVRQAVTEGRFVQLVDRSTEAGGREVRIVIS
jgi:hypothetical protein